MSNAPDWACEFVAELHKQGVTYVELGDEAGMNPKYIGQVLRGKEPTGKAESKLRSALVRIMERRVDAGQAVNQQ